MQIAPGSIVQISNLDNKCRKVIDPNFYSVIELNKKVVKLKISATGKEISVHPSRVINIISDMPKAQPIISDYKKVKGVLWSKQMNFDHKETIATKNVLILEDQKTYYHFNTYDGIGPIGNPYTFADANAYTKKVKKLTSEGYIQTVQS